MIHLIENTSAGIEGSGEVLDSGCADIDELDVSERPPDDALQSDISEKSKVRSRDRDMREEFERDAKIKRTPGNTHNRPDDNRDQFGGSGIIPFNVANMVFYYIRIYLYPYNHFLFRLFCFVNNLLQSYEEYLHRFLTHPYSMTAPNSISLY